MAKITFTIEGPPGTVTLRAFLSAFQDQLTVLTEVDAALSQRPDGVLDWVVTDLRLGSLEATIASRHRADEVAPQHDRTVARTYRNGLYAIESEGRTPGYFTDRSLVAARRTFKLIGQDGVTGFRVTTDDFEPPLAITPRAAVNIDQLIHPGRKEIGSVEGRLNVISLAGRAPRFVLYETIRHKAVSCRFAPEKLEEIKAALGRRVLVTGVVTYNRKDEPQRIALESFRLLRDRADLPTVDSMTQGYPDLTGDLSTKEYLELVRGR